MWAMYDQDGLQVLAPDEPARALVIPMPDFIWRAVRSTRQQRNAALPWYGIPCGQGCLFWVVERSEMC